MTDKLKKGKDGTAVIERR